MASRSEILELEDSGDLGELVDDGSAVWTRTEHEGKEMAYAYGSGHLFAVMKQIKFGAIYLKLSEENTDITIESTEE